MQPGSTLPGLYGEKMSTFGLLFFVMIIFSVISCFFLGWLWDRRRAKRYARLAAEKAAAEAARIAALPPLDTTWLLRVPENLIDQNPVKGYYSTRYNRLIVIDREGCGWVGLVVPEVLDALQAAEYDWMELWVPFKGPGERHCAEPVTVDGFRIDIYPMWMKAGVNPAEWTLWVQIEKHFKNTVAEGWNYQQGLGRLLSVIRERKEKNK